MIEENNTDLMNNVMNSLFKVIGKKTTPAHAWLTLKILIQKLTYNYNTNGYLDRIDKEDADGKSFINNSYSYDQKGNLIEEKWYDGIPDDYSKKLYNYDEKDNLKEVDSYYSLYKYKVLYKYTYEFY